MSAILISSGPASTLRGSEKEECRWEVAVLPPTIDMAFVLATQPTHPYIVIVTWSFRHFRVRHTRIR